MPIISRIMVAMRKGLFLFLVTTMGICGVSIPLYVYGNSHCDITVNSDLDNGDGGNTTLREAISSVPSNGVICFGIGSGYKTIVLSSELPQVNRPMTIDGLSQPRSVEIGANTPVIEIVGTNTGSSGNKRPGLWITQGSTIIRGLIINRFWGDGIIITNNGGNTIEYNYVGTNSGGTGAYGNGASGIGMQSNNNTIRKNLVSGNTGAGIAITGTGSSINANNNTVISNKVGTNAAGTSAIPNGSDGILLTDAGNNIIGGTNGVSIAGNCTGDCNLFSGNGANGIGIQGVETLTTSPTAVNNVIKGNYVGVDITGTNALPNADIGFEAQDAPNNTVGGTTPAERNIFSGNLGAGVSLTSTYSYGNVVQGNFIGVDRSGSYAIKNHKMGVNLGSPFGGSNNAHDNMIGGTTGTTPGGSCTGACNVIAGNGWSGIYISGATGGNNQISGNFIGVGPSGGHRIGNTQDGIGIVDSSNNRIGGPIDAARNLISGNGNSGIIVTGMSSGTRIEGNYIGMGTDGGCMPNGETAVTLQSGRDTAILANGIYCNTKLGIDIGPNAVSNNDAGDTDGGPNNTQNFPVLSSVSSNSSNTIVVGALNSRPNTQYRVEFFVSPVCDSPYGYGEGRTYLGGLNVTSDGAGNVSFSHSLAKQPGGQYITATATKFLSSTPYETSEFSRCVGAPRQHPDGTLVKDPNGPAIYLLENNQKRRVGSPEVIMSQNFTSSDIKPGTSVDMALADAPGVYFREGTLLKGSGPNVYVIDQTGPNNYQKRHVNSLHAFNNLGYGLSDIINVLDSALQIPDGPAIDATKHPDGTLIKGADNPTVYWTESDQKRLVGSPAVFLSQRFRSDRIKSATSADLALGNGTNVYFREGTLLKGSSSTLYVIDDTGSGFQKRPIASPDALVSLGYTSSDIVQATDAELPAQMGPVIN